MYAIVGLSSFSREGGRATRINNKCRRQAGQRMHARTHALHMNSVPRVARWGTIWALLRPPACLFLWTPHAVFGDRCLTGGAKCVPEAYPAVPIHTRWFHRTAAEHRYSPSLSLTTSSSSRRQPACLPLSVVAFYSSFVLFHAAPARLEPRFCSASSHQTLVWKPVADRNSNPSRLHRPSTPGRNTWIAPRVQLEPKSTASLNQR